VSDNDGVTSQAQHNYSGCNQEKQRLKRCVFRRLWKTDVTCCGRLFQTRAVATGMAQSPIVENHVRRTISEGEEVSK